LQNTELQAIKIHSILHVKS